MIKRLVRLVLHVALVAVVYDVGAINAAGEEKETISLGRATVGLGSCDSIAATEYFDALFDAGEASIPYLVAHFGDKRPFFGLCGARILDSRRSPATPLVDQGPGNVSRVPTVREAALYLLLATLKGSQFFAMSCEIEVPKGEADTPISLALGEIAILYVQAELHEIALDSEVVESVLVAHGLRFPVLPHNIDGLLGRGVGK